MTAAINNADIEERLGIDGYREGVLAVCGFGKPAAEPSPFDPEFLPFVPRATEEGVHTRDGRLLARDELTGVLTSKPRLDCVDGG